MGAFSSDLFVTCSEDVGLSRVVFASLLKAVLGRFNYLASSYLFS
jgi:hypothetical protein